MKRFGRSLVAVLCILVLMIPMFTLPASAAGYVDFFTDKQLDTETIKIGDVLNAVSFNTTVKYYSTFNMELGGIENSASGVTISATNARFYTDLGIDGNSVVTTKVEVTNNEPGTALMFNYSFEDDEQCSNPGGFKICYENDSTDEPIASEPGSNSTSGSYYIVANKFYIFVESATYGSAPDETMGDSSLRLYNFALYEANAKNVTVEFESGNTLATGSSILVNGTDTIALGGTTQKSYSVGSAGLRLYAQPKENYIFVGYRIKEEGEAYPQIGNNNPPRYVYVSDQREFLYRPLTDNTTITADYIPEGTPSLLVGDRGANGFVRVNTLQEAITYAGSGEEHSEFIIVLSNCEANGNAVANHEFVIPTGTKLLIPYNDNHTYYSGYDDQYRVHASNEAHPLLDETYEYRKLTLKNNAKLIVSPGASVCVAAVPQMTDNGSTYYYDEETGFGSYVVYQTDENGELVYDPDTGDLIPINSSSMEHNGPVHSYYGRLEIEDGSVLELEEDSDLFAFGFVTGANGDVIAHRGSTITEFFQINDFRGGGVTLDLARNSNQFPFNQYYIQNIGSRITYEYGCREQVFMAIYMSKKEFSLFEEYITSNIENKPIDEMKGLFILEEGSSLVRTYDTENDKVSYHVYGKTTIASLDVTIPRETAVLYGVNTDKDISLDSRNYYMPITNMQLVIEPGSELDARGKYVLLPGSSMTVSGPGYVVDPITGVGEEKPAAILNVTDGLPDPNNEGKTSGVDIILAGKEVGEYSANYQTPAIPFKPCMYFPGALLYRTWDTTNVAELNNNGVINVHEKSSMRSTGSAIIYTSEGTGRFTIGRPDNFGMLDIYVDSNHKNEPIEVDQPMLSTPRLDSEGNQLYDEDTGLPLFDTTDIAAAAGAWFDDGNGNVSQGVYRCNSEGVWGDFRDVTYFSAPLNVDGCSQLGDTISGMNVNEKTVNEASRKDDALSSYSTTNEYGVRDKDYVVDLEANWVYEPESEENQTNLNAYPKYNDSLSIHTVTWYDEDGTSELTPSEDRYIHVEYGKVIPYYTPAKTEKTPAETADHHYYTFAGWNYTDENGKTIFYARGEQLPKIERVENPIFVAVYKQCFEKHSLTLSDNIKTNFYINLPAVYDDKPESLRVDFSWGDKYVIDDNGNYTYNPGTPNTATDNLTYVGGQGTTLGKLYKVSVDTAAKEMNDTITVSLVDKSTNTVIAEEKYSVADYLYNVIDYDTYSLAIYVGNNSTSAIGTLERAELFKDLCRATLAYGASAQLALDYHTDNLVDSRLPAQYQHSDATMESNARTEILERFASKADPDSPTSQESILWNMPFEGFPFRDYSKIFSGASTAYYGSSLTLTSLLSYDLYFRYGLGYDPYYYWCSDDDFTMAAEDALDSTKTYNVRRYFVEPEWDFIRISIDGINVTDLFNDIKVTFHSNVAGVAKPDREFYVNPGVYLYNVFAYENDEDPETALLKNISANLYNYNQKAIEYFTYTPSVD